MKWENRDERKRKLSNEAAATTTKLWRTKNGELHWLNDQTRMLCTICISTSFSSCIEFSRSLSSRPVRFPIPFLLFAQYYFVGAVGTILLNSDTFSIALPLCLTSSSSRTAKKYYTIRLTVHLTNIPFRLSLAYISISYVQSGKRSFELNHNEEKRIWREKRQRWVKTHIVHETGISVCTDSKLTSQSILPLRIFCYSSM